jgi:hypothetical protein
VRPLSKEVFGVLLLDGLSAIGKKLIGPQFVLCIHRQMLNLSAGISLFIVFGFKYFKTIQSSIPLSNSNQTVPALALTLVYSLLAFSPSDFARSIGALHAFLS